MPSQVIAIDGPAGAGKSTTARAVAEKLGMCHLDSGALYRALTLGALDAECELSGQRIVGLAQSLPIGLRLTEIGFRPEVAGVDVSKEVRSPRVTARVSEVSAMPDVRHWVNQALREAAALHPTGVVVDGRDIGTVVFPDASLKVFLTAAPGERARRRLLQEGKPIDPTNLAETLEEQEVRDAADSSRSVAPLVAAADAIVIDTSEMTFEAQVDSIAREARKAFS